MTVQESFSHGLIDFIVLSGNSSKLYLFPISWHTLCDNLLLYFPFLNRETQPENPGREVEEKNAKQADKSAMGQSLVAAFGG